METPITMPPCYRHPDRPGGIVCQRCDRPICPSCMHQASVGFHCPECTKQGAQKVYQGIGALQQRPIVTQVLIGLNVAIYVIGLVLGASSVGGSLARITLDFGLVARLWQAGDSLYLGAFPGADVIGVGGGEWYRLVTSGFLHASPFHLLMNMYALWILGQAVENIGGRLRFGAVYGTALLAGSLGALLASPDQFTVGASGAIYGLMGALLLAHRARGIPFANSPLLGVLAINLVITFAIPNISIGGHLGGIAGGAVAGWALFDLAERPGMDKRVPYAICAALSVFSVLVAVMFASSHVPT